MLTFHRYPRIDLVGLHLDPRKNYISLPRDVLTAVWQKGVTAIAIAVQIENLGKEFWIANYQVILHVSDDVVIVGLLQQVA